MLDLLDGRVYEIYAGKNGAQMCSERYLRFAAAALENLLSLAANFSWWTKFEEETKDANSPKSLAYRKSGRKGVLQNLQEDKPRVIRCIFSMRCREPRLVAILEPSQHEHTLRGLRL